jgi:hypothetical protein
MRVTGSFSKASQGVYTEFQGPLEKKFVNPCSFRTAVVHYNKTGKEDSAKILKYFSRGKILKLVTKISNLLRQ